MIPASGWIAEADNANQSPERAPLPIPIEIQYGDGPQGEYEVPDDLELWNDHFLTTGEVEFIERAGFIGTGFGFLVTALQHDAYGVLLIDMLDPPNAVLEAETPDVPVPDRELCPSNDSIDSFEACCSVLDFWIFDGSVQFNGTRTFGALP